MATTTRPTTPAAGTAQADGLLTAARAALAQASVGTDPGAVAEAARLAAVRAAAAVLAVETQPASSPPQPRDFPAAPPQPAFPPTGRATLGRPSGRPVSVWALLSAVAPELGEWAAYFATVGPSAPAGGRLGVSQRVADDLVRDADRFLVLVARRVAATGPAAARQAG